MQRMRVGVIGCGNISGIYFKAGERFEILEIAAAADLDIERAKAKAEEFNIPKACSPEELLADPDIQIVINLTIPNAHYAVSRAALTAGKHVYAEKPMAITIDEGRELLKIASEKGLSIGGAPDTFLGAGLQTCREVIDQGQIGEPVGATAFMMGHGHESWHPDPEFYYKVGGGPMFDMGPYYLTALVSLIGPLQRVTGSAQIIFPERMITSQPKAGTMIAVETPTTIAGVMDFANGAVGTIITSFDTWAVNLPRIEIYGTEGSLQVPDPNGFGGPVRIWRTSERSWREVPVTRPYADNSRGIGLADMAYAIQSGGEARAGGALTFHVLEAMNGFLKASDEGRHYEMTSACPRPDAMPPDWPSEIA
ncbi:MAG TPA: Gfo/Idh/MocA family oxidoreductase [Capsulimonadaceae bacterium]|nr:Gfo/Idh/MocA family oxidoreductase [Capsulimonadaceae bacterium]